MNPGCIPMEPYLSIVKDVIKTTDYTEGDGFYSFIGRRCNLKQDSVEKALKRDHIDFDLAELILIKLGRPELWHCEPLDAFYESVELPDDLCALPGCSEPAVRLRSGGTRFCSVAHVSKARRLRKRAAH